MSDLTLLSLSGLQMGEAALGFGWSVLAHWPAGCSFIHSAQAPQESAGSQEPARDWFQIYEFCWIQFHLAGNAAATLQEQFPISAFLMALSINCLWPSPLSHRLPFPPGWQTFCFSALQSLTLCWPRAQIQFCFSFTHEYLTAVVYTCWISFSVIKIVQVYCGGRKIKCFVW